MKRDLDAVLPVIASIGLATSAVAGLLTWLVLLVLSFDGGWGLLPLSALPLAVTVLACAALDLAVHRKRRRPTSPTNAPLE